MTGFLTLFWEFFEIGLFSVGGGLATLPFLYRLAEKYPWFTTEAISDMIAISESTPGPMGVNMATYTGFQFGSVLGSITATFGLVLPSVIIIIWVSKFLEKFRKNKHVEEVFYTLRPAVTGLIASAGCSVLLTSLFHLDAVEVVSLENISSWIGVKECILFVAMLILTKKKKIHPIAIIVIGAVIGIVFQF
ncbi:chromate transporter [Chakrabartyella piscis]|uniref:chromate transporter n=1 Tax=Chakrabartyella piscis TaxID=2918914 RepID=UPI0029586BE6|nr:chromate transporter [Chakrabartyella piscis]